MQSFFTARLKLTLWYMLISYSLLALFTLAVISAEWQAFAQVIDLVHSHVRGVVFNIYLQQQIGEFEQHFVRWLLLFDGVILVIATVASYFLSGRTLGPIEVTMKAQEQFVGDVSHELRSPLASMAMQIEAYQRTPKKSVTLATEVIEGLQNDVSRMSDLVNGLLRLVRLEHDASAVELQNPSTLAEVVRVGLAQFEQMIQAKSLELSIDLGETRPVRANVDSIRQVVSILLENAVKYAPVGGELRVEVRQADGAELIVFNDGSGILSDDLPHVFDRFYRGQNAGDEGVGLGLAIARQLVERQGGRVAVASQPDQGVTFKVVWPSQR
jgi:signal transduction histidine kinase